MNQGRDCKTRSLDDPAQERPFYDHATSGFIALLVRLIRKQMKTDFDFIDRRLQGFASPLWSLRATCCAVAIASLIVDFASGPHLQVPILLILPVVLSAWYRSVAEAWGLAFGLNLVHFGFHFFWANETPLEIAGINSVIFAMVVVIVAFLVNRASCQTRLLRERVKTLEGFLSICAFCKDVRDDGGEWSRIESYIGARTPARFTHTFCPKCAEVHFPELRH